MALTTNVRNDIGEQLRDARDEVAGIRVEIGEIAGEMQRLLQMEMELARAEVQETKRRLMWGSFFGLSAGVISILFDLFLLLTVMFALDTFLPLWLSALITAGIAALIVGIFGLLAWDQFKGFSLLPRRFIQTMQEDVQWAKTQVKSSMR